MTTTFSIPLGDRVLLKQAVAAEKYGQILLPDQAREVPMWGQILAIGPKVTTVAVGDVVQFQRFSGVDTPDVDTSRSLLLIHEDELVAKFDESSWAQAREEARVREAAAKAELVAGRAGKLAP